MTGEVSVRVAGWAAWLPDAGGLEGEGTRPDAPPVALRRRVTEIGRRALAAAWAVLPPDCAPRIVLSSRHGEYARTLSLLESLAAEGEASPADFSLAVHHALAGLLSISTGNRAGHTALAAGTDTVAYGLVEAAACVAGDHAPVLWMHFDEPLPELYDTAVSDAGEPSLAVALLLVPADHPGGRPVVMSLNPANGPAGQAHGRRLVDFLRSDGGDVVLAGDSLSVRLRHAA